MSALNWKCSRCGAEVDDGFEVCWSCGAKSDGTPDPDFEVATAPIHEAETTRPPSPLMSAFIVLCFPLLLLYGLAKLLFPLHERRWQFSLGTLFFVMTIVALLMGYWYLSLQFS